MLEFFSALGDPNMDFLRNAVERYGRYWRKSARVPGAERELAGLTLDRLHRLSLIVRETGGLYPLPAIARFSLGQTEVRARNSATLPILESLT